jgi:hypothetical protein
MSKPKIPTSEAPTGQIPHSRAPARSGVAEPVLQLVSVFAEHLPQVRFPGVDAQRLAALVEDVQTRADALAEAEAALLGAREAHATASAELSRTARAGLGYARVYAADDARLDAALGEIDLGPSSAPRTTKTKRKPRAPRGDDRITKLPFTGAPESAARSVTP